MVFLETQRLALRNLAPKDVDNMADYRGSELCARHQRGQTRDRDGIAALVRRRGSDVISADVPFLLAVALRETDEIVGEVSLRPEGGVFFLGYTVSHRHHRRGYAFEILSALLRTLHERYPQQGVVGLVEPENEASIALLRKLGCRELGVTKEGVRAFGKWTSPDVWARIAAGEESPP